MPRYLLCFALLLSACGDRTETVVVPTQIPADLLVQRDGWTGPVPVTDGQFSDALFATEQARRQLNGQIAAIADIQAKAQIVGAQ